MKFCHSSAARLFVYRTRTTSFRSLAHPPNIRPLTFHPRRSSQAGVTLLETLIVAAVISLLAAMIAPGWVDFLNSYMVGSARDKAHQVIRQAQKEAIWHRVPWEVKFRDLNGTVQWSTHNSNTLPNQVVWQTLQMGVRLDTRETTLRSSDGVYRLQFDQHGRINGQLGRLTLSTASTGGRIKRCVVVSTLLGALRNASERSRPDRTGRYCY